MNELKQAGQREREPDDNPDYITRLACANPQRSIVAVMHYITSQDSYQINKCSDALSHRAALALAESWAAATGLEIR